VVNYFQSKSRHFEHNLDSLETRHSNIKIIEYFRLFSGLTSLMNTFLFIGNISSWT